MTTTKKLLTVALAATTLAIGSLAVTGEAFAKGGHHGGHGGHGGWKGGHHSKWHGGKHHKWYGHRYHRRHYFSAYYGYENPCYFVRKVSGRLIEVCPQYID